MTFTGISRRSRAGFNRQASACPSAARAYAACAALALLALAAPAQCLPTQDDAARALPETRLGGRVVMVKVSQENAEPREEPVRLPLGLLNELASRSSECLGGQDRWWDITSAFPWLRQGRILSLDCPLSEIYLEASGRATILNEEPGYGKIRAILSAGFPDALQDKNKFELMLKGLAYFTVPHGVVGTSAEFKRMKQVGELKDWLRGKVRDESVFRRYCRDPVFSYDSKSGKWSLSFYVFNPAGGVSLVQAHGSDKPFRMEAITVEEVMKAGSFLYPLVG